MLIGGAPSPMMKPTPIATWVIGPGALRMPSTKGANRRCRSMRAEAIAAITTPIVAPRMARLRLVRIASGSRSSSKTDLNWSRVRSRLNAGRQYGWSAT